MTNRWGVDVSLWQDETELSASQVNALAAAGCSFAIIRAGQNSLDLNYIRDDAVFNHLFGSGTIPPPPPPKPATVAGRTLYSMRVRSGPGTGYSTVDIIPTGTLIDGVNLGGDCWLEVEPGRWVCLYKGGQKFVELTPR